VTESVDPAAAWWGQRQVWAAGDYAQVGARIVLVSELLCEAVDPRAGQRVLDVATGTGNAALAAARRSCEVTGLDYVPALLDRAGRRAAAEGLPVTFLEGDAEKLPFADRSFDVVLSAFGVMFARDAERATRELLRVCRPGGKIGLASWRPAGFVGELMRLLDRTARPVPAQQAPPVLWGTEGGLRELLGGGTTSLRTLRRSVTFRYRSPEHFLGFFRANYGPMLKAFGRLNPAEQSELAGDVEQLVRRFGNAEGGAVAWPMHYLEAVAVRQ
jgi:SAM-dependent methyltransferase